ncbi:hypothetical protein PVAP13_9NG756900 [Panicum virgatum]|uniref:Uncharacterized protein n=1 Tax=Panicum virgatum TaxID=38727 RepID=A0A8T0N496_PANVG|nr:hypothetical protein PVAP13_9NG756900 [Panicum virgatum]
MTPPTGRTTPESAAATTVSRTDGKDFRPEHPKPKPLRASSPELERTGKPSQADHRGRCQHRATPTCRAETKLSSCSHTPRVASKSCTAVGLDQRTQSRDEDRRTCCFRDRGPDPQWTAGRSSPPRQRRRALPPPKPHPRECTAVAGPRCTRPFTRRRAARAGALGRCCEPRPRGCSVAEPGLAAVHGDAAHAVAGERVREPLLVTRTLELVTARSPPPVSSPCARARHTEAGTSRSGGARAGSARLQAGSAPTMLRRATKSRPVAPSRPGARAPHGADSPCRRLPRRPPDFR